MEEDLEENIQPQVITGEMAIDEHVRPSVADKLTEKDVCEAIAPTPIAICEVDGDVREEIVPVRTHKKVRYVSEILRQLSIRKPKIFKKRVINKSLITRSRRDLLMTL